MVQAPDIKNENYIRKCEEIENLASTGFKQSIVFDENMISRRSYDGSVLESQDTVRNSQMCFVPVAFAPKLLKQDNHPPQRNATNQSQLSIKLSSVNNS